MRLYGADGKDYGQLQVAHVSNSEIGQDNIGRVLPRQVSTGSLRGTQSVGYGTTKIDGSNNTITVGDSILLDGNNDVINVTSNDKSQLGMGVIPGAGNSGQSGFYSVNAAGKLIFKIVNGILFMYDGVTGINTLQMGALSNGTTNLAIAKPGNDVQAALNS